MAVNKKSLKNIKPPVKGEVRNPNGRAKGSLNSKTVIRKWLEMIATETIIDPKTQKKKIVQKKDASGKPLTYFDAMVVAQMQKAVSKNDTAAFSALLDRLEGRPKQVNEVQIHDGAVVRIGGKEVDDE
jgi:hypothetical protein